MSMNICDDSLTTVRRYVECVRDFNSLILYKVTGLLPYSYQFDAMLLGTRRETVVAIHCYYYYYLYLIKPNEKKQCMRIKYNSLRTRLDAKLKLSIARTTPNNRSLANRKIGYFTLLCSRSHLIRRCTFYPSLVRTRKLSLHRFSQPNKHMDARVRDKRQASALLQLHAETRDWLVSSG